MILKTYRTTTLYKLGKSKFFRASSTKLWKQYGGNLQNIPKELRKVFIADEGKLLCQRDQSGAEALIVAYLCTKGRFRDLFLHNVKPHVFVALHNFIETWQLKCKELDVKKFVSSPIAELKNLEGWKTLDSVIKESDNWAAHERYYYIAKMLCHASNYGMKADAFRLHCLEKSRGAVVLSKDFAERSLMNYHSLFPEIHDWHRWVDAQVDRHKVLYNLFGYPFQITSRISEYDKKDLYAFAPQSTVGIITHIAVTNMQYFIEKEKLDWDILNNNHDSFLVQAPEKEITLCNMMMKTFIEQDLVSPRGEKFRMKSEGAIGLNWSNRKEKLMPDGTIKVENPEGLKPTEI